ncbi:ABC transporter ATP-binding protein [Clostridium sp. E02]|uniref:ABC transporter ATP-binding protein n=1 Tax=Clostridium sp. E02 TaxID=2487134 RepID=UPI000F5425EA|nr:ABC transporter ATP-binding protein [Clostridium sp. E02]
MREILSVNHLKKKYGCDDNTLLVIQDISFKVIEGEFISIMGSSGSGKTTLLNCISTIDDATEGNVLIEETDLTMLNESQKAKFRRENLGFIFQEYNLLDTLTVEENISLALTLNHLSVAKIKEKVSEIAEQLSIKHILTKYPYEISGGEKQRCACGRAVIHSPKLVLADEPTGALDSGNSRTLMETIDFMNKKMGTTVMVVTHDSVVSSYAQRVIFIKDGKIYNDIVLKKISLEEKRRKIMEIEEEMRRQS